MCVIAQNKCWVEHLPFLRMVKFHFLSQFSVDHIAHQVVSSLLLILSQFAAFANHVIDRFVSITT